MFWEEEMREQSKILAEQLAPEMAKDMAQNMAKDLAKDMAQNIAQEKVIETARKFLEMNLTPEQVSKGTNLPLEQVLELKKQMELK